MHCDLTEPKSGAGVPHRPAPIAVLKFGSSVLRGAEGFRVAAHEVRRQLVAGNRVVAVVSAGPGTTDALWRYAHDLAPRPAASLLGTLLATGEDASVALLGIALARLRIRVRTLPHHELGLRTEGPLLDATPVAVDVCRLRAALLRHQALVVPGFVGRSRGGLASLLGRGGSDLTALFLAAALEAVECRLIKDVDGLYLRDPHRPSSGPTGNNDNRRYRVASWDDARRSGTGLVQHKALDFARARGVGFRIAAPGGTGTEVGPGPGQLDAQHAVPSNSPREGPIR